MRSDLDARYSIGEPSHENEFVVYPATDKRMGWSVSIVEPDLGLKADKDRLQRAWISINDAKSLPPLRFVEILDLVAPTDFDDNFYIVEKRPKKTLRQYIEEQEMLDFDRAVEVVRHVLEGLATLHGAGYAHDALTDRCIYVSEDYSGLSVRIGNLHLVSRIGEAIVPPYAPEFGAPDLYRAGVFNASAAPDVYSAGMIAYKLFLPGRTYADIFQDVMVWEEEHQRDQNWKNIHVDETKVFPRLDTLVPGLPAALAALVERMLSRDPAARPRDATEALAEFRRATGGLSPRHPYPLPQPMPPAPPKPPPRRWSTGKVAAFAVLALLAAGVGAVTVPMLLRPDPELVAGVEAWKAEAENRRAKAVAAKAPERAPGEPARTDFDAAAAGLKTGGAAVAEEDYEAALPIYQKAADDFARSIVGVALADAEKSREGAKAAGGEKAPAFAASQAKIAAARESAAAAAFRPAIDGLKQAKTDFDALAADLAALAAGRKTAEARREDARRAGGEASPDFGKASAGFDAAASAAAQWDAKAAASGFAAAGKSFAALADALTALDKARGEASGKRDTALRLGASESPGFGKTAAVFDDAETKAKRWDAKAAGTGFADAAEGFDALIAEVMGAEGPATAMKKKVADLHASLARRAGDGEPVLAAAAPRIADADSRFSAKAYKLALAAYEPILKDLEALSAQGFCPASKEAGFRAVAAGSYPLDKVRLMTSSLSEFGGMLGVVNGAAKVERPFCMGAHVVTRGEMAAFRAAEGNGAAAGEGDPVEPADDVTWQEAERYAAWMSSRLGANVRLPSAQEWMAGAAGQSPGATTPPDDGDIVLQWSATPCEGGGYVAFLAQADSTFAVCSDASTGGIFRVTADLK